MKAHMILRLEAQQDNGSSGPELWLERRRCCGQGPAQGHCAVDVSEPLHSHLKNGNCSYLWSCFEECQALG